MNWFLSAFISIVLAMYTGHLVDDYHRPDYFISKIIDADTFELVSTEWRDERRIRVRLHGIDAPDITTYCDGYPYGKFAKKWVEDNFLGVPVRADLHYSDRLDHYVASLYIHDTTIGLSGLMVQSGWARRWDYDGDKPRPNSCELIKPNNAGVENG